MRVWADIALRNIGFELGSFGFVLGDFGALWKARMLLKLCRFSS